LEEVARDVRYQAGRPNFVRQNMLIVGDGTIVVILPTCFLAGMPRFQRPLKRVAGRKRSGEDDDGAK
jgi:hypothetical protein